MLLPDRIITGRSDPRLVRSDLMNEAIRLSTVVSHLLPNEREEAHPEGEGLDPGQRGRKTRGIRYLHLTEAQLEGHEAHRRGADGHVPIDGRGDARLHPVGQANRIQEAAQGEDRGQVERRHGGQSHQDTWQPPTGRGRRGGGFGRRGVRR